ncbi:hypothetical protein HD554DRAFT_2168744 [Boletus coccyginus]|nr:hypothetical protein HD554DRAFT_2168744 [Boletus coccyginus]
MSDVKIWFITDATSGFGFAMLRKPEVLSTLTARYSPIQLSNYHAATQHPAHADPALRGSQVRKFLSSTELFDGDATKVAVVVEKLSRFEDTVPVTQEGRSGHEEQGKGLSEAADKYEKLD